MGIFGRRTKMRQNKTEGRKKRRGEREDKETE